MATSLPFKMFLFACVGTAMEVVIFERLYLNL